MGILGNTPVWDEASAYDVVQTNITDDDGSTHSTTSLYNNYTGQKSRSNYNSIHKSFDLSDVAMYGSNGTERDKNYSLRKFHQTRIFIKGFEGMFHHTEVMSNKNATYLVTANLPESIGYSFGSTWKQPLSDIGGALTNTFMQVLASNIPTYGKDLPSARNRAVTLKIWDGSEPLSISLKIPVLDDGYYRESDATGIHTNLVEALEFMGSLCLPTKGISNLGFYTPPPSPLAMNIQYGKKENQSISLDTTPGRIMVQLGGILLIDNCIIENVNVEYPNTKNMIRHYYKNGLTIGDRGNTYLHPQLAMVTIKLSTIEALTANTFSKMLWLSQQTGEGKGGADMSEFVSENYATGIDKARTGDFKGAWNAVTGSNNSGDQVK